jgi:hypothetical protein
MSGHYEFAPIGIARDDIRNRFIVELDYDPQNPPTWAYVGSLFNGQDTAHAVTLEREAIAKWHEERSHAFTKEAERLLASRAHGDAVLHAQAVAAFHDASAVVIRDGAHNEGAGDE